MSVTDETVSFPHQCADPAAMPGPELDGDGNPTGNQVCPACGTVIEPVPAKVELTPLPESES